MPPNYSQLPALIKTAVRQIPATRREVADKVVLARHLLNIAAQTQDELREDVVELTDRVDRLLRCAVPGDEAVNSTFPPGPLPE